MNHIKKSSYFHFGNNHPEVLTYYQIAAVIPKMAYVRTLQIFFVSVGQMLNQMYFFRNNIQTQLEKI